jgi:psiF repeat-containing protein
MSKLLSLIVAAMFAAVSVAAIAQADKSTKMEKAPKKEATVAQKKQQERMKACNEQASDKKLKGDDRKKFMSSCLKPAAKKASAKSEKMDTKAKDKK